MRKETLETRHGKLNLIIHGSHIMGRFAWDDKGQWSFIKLIEEDERYFIAIQDKYRISDKYHISKETYEHLKQAMQEELEKEEQEREQYRKQKEQEKQSYATKKIWVETLVLHDDYSTYTKDVLKKEIDEVRDKYNNIVYDSQLLAVMHELGKKEATIAEVIEYWNQKYADQWRARLAKKNQQVDRLLEGELSEDEEDTLMNGYAGRLLPKR